MQPKKKRIVVIGASRGIGASVAQHFAQKGDQPKAGAARSHNIHLNKLYCFQYWDDRFC